MTSNTRNCVLIRPVSSLSSSCGKFGNGKPLQYPCLENPMNSMKRQKNMTPEDEPPRLVGSPNKLQGKSREIVPERMCISIFYTLRLVAVHHCAGGQAYDALYDMYALSLPSLHLGSNPDHSQVLV